MYQLIRELLYGIVCGRVRGSTVSLSYVVFRVAGKPARGWGRPAGRVGGTYWLVVEAAAGPFFTEALGAERVWPTATARYSNAQNEGQRLREWSWEEVRCVDVVGCFDARGESDLPSFYYVVQLVARYWQVGGRRLDTWTGQLLDAPAAPSPERLPAAAPAPTPGLRSTPLVAPPEEAWLIDLETVLGPEAGVRALVVLWVAGGLSERKLKSAVRGAVDKRLVFERLVKAEANKGIYQQRVVIDDYTNIPGAVKAPYVNNSLPEEELLASAFGVADPRFNLPSNKAITFTGQAELREVKPGEKLYRVTSDPTNDPRAKTGGFWTRTPPAQLAEVIGGTAVMPEWNNFQRVYEFTAPPYADPDKEEPKFYVWEGPTAAQPVSRDYKDKKANGYSLPGGEPQAFINNHLAWSEDFPKHITDITSSHKTW